MYLEKVSVLFSCDWINFVTIVDIYMLAIVAVPIAVPLIVGTTFLKKQSNCNSY